MEANWHRHYFSIADHRVGVFFREGQTNDLALIPSYEPFRTTEEEDCVMVMEVETPCTPCPRCSAVASASLTRATATRRWIGWRMVATSLSSRTYGAAHAVC